MFRFTSLFAMICLFATTACGQTTQTSNTASFDHKPIVHRFERDFTETDRIKMAQDTDAALSTIIKRIAAHLRSEAAKEDATADRIQARGALLDALDHRDQAVKLRNASDDFVAEWERSFKGQIPAMVYTSIQLERETPELYTPMSDFLRDWYHTVKELIGEQACVTLHFDDIQVINEGTPVVLRLKKWMADQVPTSQVYEQYFDPWAGCVAYWLVWAGCEAVTYGAGIVLVCSPIAMMAENFVFYQVAPHYSDRVYQYVYR